MEKLHIVKAENAGNLTVNAGTIQVSNTGSGSRGIKIDGTYTKSANATVQANIKN